ncbi:hypothetical protein [Streptomyces hiroshimensis]|uniref:Secreted protein n=1 Tax=Streptomyces hiroshimensis TaxID=66424 RepID=A0ABQ2ZAX8_9ACTN|nr:hypothetical protein [Streptomyces hiroshimensis]GGY10494.1 hypothetical protein GCM10010324_66670 [Streptomyces hiroshimensis]
MVGETVVIRGLAAAAAAAAVVGAVLMRRWDRSAGRRVAQLTAARTRDEWKTEERIAELETDLEDTRAAKARLESKLRGKRAELARLRTEHADLLRRYATAETGRASALESRRVARGGAPALERGAPLTVPGPAVDPAAYRKAAEALRSLSGSAAEAEPKAGARPAAESAAGSGAEPAALPRQKPASTSRTASGTVPQPRPEARRGSERAPEPVKAGKPVEPATEDKQPESGAALRPALRAAVPQAPARRPASRATGGFDFFGTQRPAPAQRPVEETDLADVVGEEALAEAEAEAEAEAGKDGERAGDDVIDLTAHDETEQIDVAELRTAAS